MTVKPTSEELMAYADGQLEGEHARRIEQALAALQLGFQIFVRHIGSSR
jgi:anti-sigma factor RsiW